MLLHILINMLLSASFLLKQEEGGTRPNPHNRRLGLREPSRRYLTVLIGSFEHITTKLVKVTHSGEFNQRQFIVGELLGEGSVWF